MKGHNVDFAYAVDLLRRINATKVAGQPLASSFLIDSYNIWHWYQKAIFIEILRLLEYPDDIKKDPSALGFIGSLKYFSFSVFAWFLTLFALRRKASVLMYAIDKNTSRFVADERARGLYEFLFKHHIPFVELFHSVFGRQMAQNAMRRKRSGIYLELADARLYLLQKLGFRKRLHVDPRTIDLSEFREEEKGLALRVIAGFIAQTQTTRARIDYLTKVVRRGGYEQVIGIDDVRHYNELLYVCKKEKIPTHIFQHGGGHFNIGYWWDSGFAGEQLLPDHFYVWSTYWEKCLRHTSAAYEESDIAIATPDQTSSVVWQTGSADDKNIAVFVPYEVDAPKDKIRQYMQAIAGCPHAAIFFKVRRDMSIDDQILDYGLAGLPHTVVVDTKDSPRPHLALGTYSTMLYTLAEDEIPIGTFDTSMPFGENLITDGLAERIVVSTICEQLDSLKNTPKGILSERKEKLASGRVPLDVVLEKLFKKN